MTASAIKRMFGIEDRELRPALMSGLLFFLILCGYYILRPLREEMGLNGGIKNLPWLYLANLGIMLALAPLFGAVGNWFWVVFFMCGSACTTCGPCLCSGLSWPMVTGWKAASVFLGS